MLFPSPGDLPNPGIEPRSPALQADALPSEPPGKVTVYRVAKSQDRSNPVHIDARLFVVCGSFAPVRVEREGGAATWLVGTLSVPSVQGHKLPLRQELRPYQSLFSSFL